jgi:hypothetical protein
MQAVTRKLRYMIITVFVGTLLLWLGAQAIPPEEVFTSCKAKSSPI